MWRKQKDAGEIRDSRSNMETSRIACLKSSLELVIAEMSGFACFLLAASVDS